MEVEGGGGGGGEGGGGGRRQGARVRQWVVSVQPHGARRPACVECHGSSVGATVDVHESPGPPIMLSGVTSATGSAPWINSSLVTSSTLRATGPSPSR
eukprot:5763408-Pyramimonas_sp.AAC.1